MKLEVDKRNVVVVGASVGGVQALTALFQQLPASLPAAVLIAEVNGSIDSGLWDTLRAV
jgi:chemotaxis response regulator CheB